MTAGHRIAMPACWQSAAHRAAGRFLDVDYQVAQVRIGTIVMEVLSREGPRAGVGFLHVGECFSETQAPGAR